MKKVAIIGSAGIPARYGGFETLAQNLVYNLYSRFNLVVYCTKKLYNKQERQVKYKYAELIYLPVNANGAQSIIYDSISIIHALRKADALLILGISGCLFLPFARVFSHKKIITNIDGLEWKRSKWNLFTKLILKLSEYLAIKYSDHIIADNESISKYILKKYNLIPEIIEYGGDPAELKSDKNNAADSSFTAEATYALTIARIEPENNIHIILNAFSKMPVRKITVVGNWTHNRYSRRLYKSYSHYPNITLYDPVYDQNFLNLLRSKCEVYIHGHSAGGTNPALVEAMYSGRPVIAYDVPYNRSTTAGKALYFINSDDLINIIMQKNKSVFDRNKKHMKEIADLKFRWKIISSKYAELF